MLFHYFFPEFLKEEEMFDLYLCTQANIVYNT